MRSPWLPLPALRQRTLGHLAASLVLPFFPQHTPIDMALTPYGLYAMLLVAGDKPGGSEKRFYRELIRKADERFSAHLALLKKERK
jgi:hypothetical protein